MCFFLFCFLRCLTKTADTDPTTGIRLCRMYMVDTEAAATVADAMDAMATMDAMDVTGAMGAMAAMVAMDVMDAEHTEVERTITTRL